MAEDGNEKVREVLQEAITELSTLSLCYKLYKLDTERFGFDISSGWDTLHSQCEDQADDLVKRMFLEGGEPELNPEAAKVDDDVESMLDESLDEEESLLKKCVKWAETCWTEGDLSNFHYFQHLAKWHKCGGNGNKGHVKWLKKQIAQIEHVGGIKQYLQAQIVK